ncbi:MAG: penicillin-binding transpeptidase domain-containing protein, partial [Opitutaceae bacterium]
MPRADTNLADRSGNLVESHKGYDPRIVFFYFVIAGLLLVLAVGLAYQQLYRIGTHEENQRQQSQRLVLFPGSRGLIYDRNRVPLVTNSYRWSAILHLDELKAELRREAFRIHANYKDAKTDAKDIPSFTQRTKIARVSLVQHHLDRINAILGREIALDRGAVEKHFERDLLLPFTLVDGLTDEEHARLVERLPVNSPLEIQPVIYRSYPFGSAAAHTLGYVRTNPDVEAKGFSGAGLKTFKAKTGTIGKDGLEKEFDKTLQGEAGGNLYRVDQSGYRINPPLEQRPPKKGQDLVTSLDIDLQIVAENALVGKTAAGMATMPDVVGAAVALDVKTGEVLVLASKPDYDLNEFSPRATQKIVDQIQETRAWNNLALDGLYSPGSTFKILTTIAALRRGAITPDAPVAFCDGQIMVGNRAFKCDVGKGHHGNILLRDAISLSCDVYYYEAGRLTTARGIAEEARRFHLDRRTGIELPGETGRMVIPDPDWKQRVKGESWVPGDTANMSIGQGDVSVSPLQMACFAASIARDEVFTQPTLIHRPDAPTQRHEPIGLSPAQRTALIEGMEGTILR